MRRRVSSLAWVIPVVLTLSCGGSPSAPGGTPTPNPPAQPTNQPPTIESIAIGVERAEVGDRVPVSATVRDQETPVADLQYAWSADAGTFEGQGASVVWLPPADRATPAEYTMRLTVTETYGVADTSGVRPKNVVSATSTASVRVHNSPREIGDMSRGFSARLCHVGHPGGHRGPGLQRQLQGEGVGARGYQPTTARTTKSLPRL